MASVRLVLEPDEDFAGCGVLCVDGTVDGEPHRFVLDSGSPTTQLLPTRPRAGNPDAGLQTASGLFGSSVVELVEVSDLSVPGLTAGPRTVSCSTAQQPGLRSLLGLDVFGDHALLLDGPATRLDVLPSGVLGTDRPLQRGARGHCSLPVALPGCSARALWDTGAGITVVSSALHDAQPGLFTPMRTATGTDATGLQRVTDVHRMAGYRIGDVDFTGHPVAVVDLPQEAGSFDLVLGQPTLRQAVWTIDLPAGRWSVSAARPAGVG